jgi:hypothetical protein
MINIYSFMKIKKTPKSFFNRLFSGGRRRSVFRSGLVATVLIFLLAACPLHTMAQAPDLNYVWGHGMGSNVGDAGTAIATDAAGNVYVTGRFNGTVDFDRGPGTSELISNGGRDVFVVKYDPEGQFLWGGSMGNNSSSLHDDGASIAVDDSGNVYVAGFFSGKVDFDFGPDTAFLTAPTVSSRYNGMFLAKYDSAGNYIWAKGITGINRPINSGYYVITLDGKGNLYMAGVYTSTAPVDFDPGPGTTELPIANSDIFFARYTTDGDLVWVEKLTSSSSDLLTGIATDPLGNFYVTGQFGSTTAQSMDFDPGPDPAILTTTGNADLFVASYDSDGNYRWAFPVGGKFVDYGNAIAVDGAGFVYVTGMFRDSADFDPGPDTVLITSAISTNHTFIAKYDSLGNYVWAKKMPGSNSEGLGISLDANANVYMTGSFSGTVDFDPGTGTADLTSQGSTDVVIAKYDSSGNYITARHMGGTGADLPAGIAATAEGNVYYTGSFSSTATFNPGDPVPVTATSAGGIDIFIAKAGCAHATDYKHITCDSSYLLNGISYNATGRYTQRYTNVAGCDSLVHLDLTINYQPPVHLYETTCDSFVYDNQIYRQTGDYPHTFISMTGCDSMVILHLSVNTSDTTLVITACDSFSLNGTSYTSSGTYTQTLQNAAGCDSLVTLDLTINNAPEASVVQTGSLLAAGSADEYQWLDCGNGNTSIPGATSQTFTPTQTGSYAVVMTDLSGCSDTSECITVEIVNDGVQRLGALQTIRLYPNPTSGRLSLTATTELSGATVRIQNSVGQLLAELRPQGHSAQLDMRSYADGIYFIEIKKEGEAIRFKVIKEQE